ncbi:hypothetical protein C6341_g18544 [Phytophthora cactorum]|nr:hypothetical protein C6341_g18544 [Phytophthora cactorum]
MCVVCSEDDSKKSKWLLKKKQRKLITRAKLQDKAEIRRPTSPLPLNVVSRLQQLSHYRDTEAQRKQRMRKEEV